MPAMKHQGAISRYSRCVRHGVRTVPVSQQQFREIREEYLQGVSGYSPYTEMNNGVTFTFKSSKTLGRFVSNAWSLK